MKHQKIIHPLTRREFLKAGGIAGGLFGLSHFLPLNSFASTAGATGPFFIIIKAPGGMDATLGLDPYIRPMGTDEQDMFIEYSPSEILSHPSQPELLVGPAAAPILSHLSNSLIINGLVMNESDNGHTANLNYAITANGQGRNASLAGELLAVTASTSPFGLVSTGSATLGKRALAVTQTGTILKSLESPDFSRFLGRIDFGSGEDSSFGRSARSLSLNKTEAEELTRLLKTWQSEKVNLQDFHAVAASLLSGMARTAEISFDSFGLDTHSDHPGRHKDAQLKVWQQVADIYTFFKSVPCGNAGASLFDHTIFMVASEFSRTPFLNPSKGKDHNPLTNSVLLSGGAIKKGKLIGKSTLVSRKRTQYGESMHIGLPIDYSTGAAVH
ncbi:MAG: DUF1501 domain-containing protein, partial [Bdellovibrionales bacterium]|nr:DUF1501 domain-containing protein [Bdellovibrionales bacterium]